MNYLPSKETDNYGNWYFKVGNPHLSNNIPQMRSEGFTPYFATGGSNAVPYYLGFKGNTSSSLPTYSNPYISHYLKAVHEIKEGKHHKK